jgi:hypothetical protein
MQSPTLKFNGPKASNTYISYLGALANKKQMSPDGQAVLASIYPDVAPPVEPGQPPVDFTVLPERTLTDDEVFEMMKASPEFEFLPKPATWYKKYGLEPIKPRNFKEYLDDDAYFEARAKYISEKVIFRGPQPGGVRPVPPPEVIPVEITQRPVAPSEVWGLEEQSKVESAPVS